MWRSPDGRAVALVVAGKLLSQPVRRTMLIIQTADGRYLETMDESTHSHARIANIMLLMNADFYELWHNHAQRLATIESTVSIPAGQTFAFMNARADAQTRFLVDAGLSEFVDPAQTVHRHTWSGSFRVALTNAGSISTIAKTQHHRAGIKRPGTKGYEPAAVVPLSGTSHATPR